MSEYEAAMMSEPGTEVSTAPAAAEHASDPDLEWAEAQLAAASIDPDGGTLVTFGDEYGFDPEIAKGKWFNMPKLGHFKRPNGSEEMIQVRLAMWGDENPNFKKQMQELREKKGDGQGNLKPEDIENAMPVIMAATVFTGLRTKITVPGEPDTYEPGISSRFVGGGDPWPDSVPRRLSLIRKCGNTFQLDLIKIAQNTKNYKDLGEDALGN